MANALREAAKEKADYSDLQGKVALVTGGSRGIGAAICRQLGAHGVRVAVNGRDAAAIDAVVGTIRAGGGQATPAPADITSFDAIEAMRKQVEEQFGPVDILIANAGGTLTRPGPIEQIEEASWRATIDANLTATFLTIKSFLPGMKERKSGNIITISSAAARRPHPNSPIPYAAAKAGIQILTQDVAAQAGPLGIRVNCIAPETIPPNATTRISRKTSSNHWWTIIPFAVLARRMMWRAPSCFSLPGKRGGSRGLSSISPAAR
jgi:3-oxoacyl-[acyl-carrier protein] reductase